MKSPLVSLGIIVPIVISIYYFHQTSGTQQIVLNPTEIGIIGYGSLTSKKSMEKTLNRPYDGVFEMVELHNWTRNWYASMPNDGKNGYSRFYTVIDSQKVFPKKILYLNISPEEDEFINCCLFVIDTSELKLISSREWIYNEVDVSGDLSTKIIGSKVIAYQVKPEFLDISIASKTIEECAVRYTYQQTIDDAFNNLGANYKNTFYQTTMPYPKDLLIDDKKEPKSE